MSGSQHIIECGHDGGDVVEHLQCDEIMCSPYVFPEGVTGSTGSNGCVQNESLSAVTQPVCDLACQSGYSPSNTEPPTLHCNITGGEAWSHFTCDENTCDALTLPLGVVGVQNEFTACNNETILTSTTNPSCSINCSESFTEYVVITLTRGISGGTPTTTLECEENECDMWIPTQGLIGGHVVDGVMPCYSNIILTSESRSECSVTCNAGYVGSGSSQIVTCPSHGGQPR